MPSASVTGPLRRDVEAAGLEGVWLGPGDVTDETETAGAYLLVIKLEAPMRISRPAAQAGGLEPGWYVYAGSARGRGGIEARLRHHFRRKKGGHWHIDQLTPRASQMTAFAVPGGDECDLAGRLSASFAFDVAVPGFGSSDCPICPSHLLVWRPVEDRPA